MAIVTVRKARLAEKYFAEHLSEGNTLARLVPLRRIDFTRGGFRVAMPMTVDQSQPLDFRHESVPLDGDEELVLARTIKSFIHNPDSAVLMQHREASISDPWLEKLEPNLRSLVTPYKTEVYLKVAGSDLTNLSDDEMWTGMSYASQFPFVAFFYRDGISPSKAALTDADLETVARNLVGVAVGAFDWRSFLIWWQDDRRPFPSAPQRD